MGAAVDSDDRIGVGERDELVEPKEMRDMADAGRDDELAAAASSC